MTTNKLMATSIQNQQLRKNDSKGLLSPGLLAKQPKIGLLMFIIWRTGVWRSILKPPGSGSSSAMG